MNLSPEIELMLEKAVKAWRRKYAPQRRSESELVILIMGARIGYELATNKPAEHASKGELR